MNTIFLPPSIGMGSMPGSTTTTQTQLTRFDQLGSTCFVHDGNQPPSGGIIHQASRKKGLQTATNTPANLLRPTVKDQIAIGASRHLGAVRAPAETMAWRLGLAPVNAERVFSPDHAPFEEMLFDPQIQSLFSPAATELLNSFAQANSNEDRLALQALHHDLTRYRLVKEAPHLTGAVIYDLEEGLAAFGLVGTMQGAELFIVTQAEYQDANPRNQLFRELEAMISPSTSLTLSDEGAQLTRKQQQAFNKYLLTSTYRRAIREQASYQGDMQASPLALFINSTFYSEDGFESDPSKLRFLWDNLFARLYPNESQNILSCFGAPEDVVSLVLAVCDTKTEDELFMRRVCAFLAGLPLKSDQTGHPVTLEAVLEKLLTTPGSEMLGTTILIESLFVLNSQVANRLHEAYENIQSSHADWYANMGLVLKHWSYSKEHPASFAIFKQGTIERKFTQALSELNNPKLRARAAATLSTLLQHRLAPQELRDTIVIRLVQAVFDAQPKVSILPFTANEPIQTALEAFSLTSHGMLSTEAIDVLNLLLNFDKLELGELLSPDPRNPYSYNWTTAAEKLALAKQINASTLMQSHRQAIKTVDISGLHLGDLTQCGDLSGLEIVGAVIPNAQTMMLFLNAGAVLRNSDYSKIPSAHSFVKSLLEMGGERALDPLIIFMYELILKNQWQGPEADALGGTDWAKTRAQIEALIVNSNEEWVWSKLFRLSQTDFDRPDPLMRGWDSIQADEKRRTERAQEVRELTATLLAQMPIALTMRGYLRQKCYASYYRVAWAATLVLGKMQDPRDIDLMIDLLGRDTVPTGAPLAFTGDNHIIDAAKEALTAYGSQATETLIARLNCTTRIKGVVKTTIGVKKTILNLLLESDDPKAKAELERIRALPKKDHLRKLLGNR